MPNPSRSRLTPNCADVRLSPITGLAHSAFRAILWIVAISLTLATGSVSAATKKHVPVAPPLPSMPAPVTHTQTTTVTTTTTTSTAPKTDAYSWAAPPPKLPTTVVYDGQSGDKAGLSVLAWGGGSGGVSTDMSYSHGGHAIKVVTHGLYEGVKLNFASPVPFTQNAAKNRVFQLLVRFGQASDNDDDTGKADLPLSSTPQVYAVSGGPSKFSGGVYTVGSGHGWVHTTQGPGYPGGGYPGGGYPGAPGANRGRGRRQGGAPYPGGGYPGGGYPGGGYPNGQNPNMPGYGAVPRANTDADWNPQIHYFRLLFTLQDGSQAEIVRPTPWPTAFEDPDTTWFGIDVPLSLLKFGDSQSNSPLVGITIGGDGPATFYIGQMNLVDDDAPITCSAGPTQDVAAGDDITFTARAQGGASMLTYSWDFDASDGIIAEADGATAVHRYAKGNKDYTATLTVSDLDGIKKPCTSTVKIKVEE